MLRSGPVWAGCRDHDRSAARQPSPPTHTPPKHAHTCPIPHTPTHTPTPAPYPIPPVRVCSRGGSTATHPVTAATLSRDSSWCRCLLDGGMRTMLTMTSSGLRRDGVREIRARYPNFDPEMDATIGGVRHYHDGECAQRSRGVLATTVCVHVCFQQRFACLRALKDGSR